MTRAPFSRRRAFTRVDLAVVVFTSLIVVGLLQASAMKDRGAAASAQCQNNLHNIGEGIHQYASAHDGNFPPMLDYGFYATNPGWMPFWYSLYPELEQNALYAQGRGSDGWAKGNHTTVVKLLQCPSDPSSKAGICTSGATGWAGTSYAPVAPLFGSASVFKGGAQKALITRAKFGMDGLTATKGASNQVGVVERFASFPKYGWSNAALYPMGNSWGMNPYGSAYGAWGLFPPQTGMSAANAHPYYPNSAHSTCQVLMMDGAVKPVTSKVNAQTWRIVCDPDSADVIPGDWDR